MSADMHMHIDFLLQCCDLLLQCFDLLLQVLISCCNVLISCCNVLISCCNVLISCCNVLSNRYERRILRSCYKRLAPKLFHEWISRTRKGLKWRVVVGAHERLMKNKVQYTFLAHELCHPNITNCPLF